ncbi:MAG: XdhC family protein [Rhodospirillales bacterium]|jgi:xanthine dehydrogenase accessory factor|nr:XdhC family protein [Rhodospirillales bacterium]
MDEDGQVLDRAIGWLGQGRRVALATVIGTWGSAPRAPGSLLALADDSAFIGSVSGGCIEGAVIEEGRGVIAGAAPRVLDFGVSDEQAWEVGLACGGEMKVYVEQAPSADTLRALMDERPVALVTELATGAHALVRPDRVGGDFSPSPAIVESARRALAEDRSFVAPDAPGELFINVFNRPLRMMMVGAVHIAQGLAPMAALAGFDVTVVDPRRAFATEGRFPGVTLSHEWPDTALEALAPDSRTAVVTLTHDPKLDDPALAVALNSNAFYIGALGSRRTHAKRSGRLAEKGFSEGAIARIRSPVGLPLGGRKATEIAVSILAQVVQASHAVAGADEAKS